MQASGQRVQVFKAHFSDWHAKLASFIFSDLARDYGPTRKPVNCQSDYAVYGAEFCGIVV
jgi:hypothetical protein